MSPPRRASSVNSGSPSPQQQQRRPSAGGGKQQPPTGKRSTSQGAAKGKGKGKKGADGHSRDGSPTSAAEAELAAAAAAAAAVAAAENAISPREAALEAMVQAATAHAALRREAIEAEAARILATSRRLQEEEHAAAVAKARAQAARLQQRLRLTRGGGSGGVESGGSAAAAAESHSALTGGIAKGASTSKWSEAFSRKRAMNRMTEAVAAAAAAATASLAASTATCSHRDASPATTPTSRAGSAATASGRISSRRGLLPPMHGRSPRRVGAGPEGHSVEAASVNDFSGVFVPNSSGGRDEAAASGDVSPRSDAHEGARGATNNPAAEWRSITPPPARSGCAVTINTELRNSPPPPPTTSPTVRSDSGAATPTGSATSSTRGRSPISGGHGHQTALTAGLYGVGGSGLDTSPYLERLREGNELRRAQRAEAEAQQQRRKARERERFLRDQSRKAQLQQKRELEEAEAQRQQVGDGASSEAVEHSNVDDANGNGAASHRDSHQQKRLAYGEGADEDSDASLRSSDDEEAAADDAFGGTPRHHATKRADGNGQKATEGSAESAAHPVDHIVIDGAEEDAEAGTKKAAPPAFNGAAAAALLTGLIGLIDGGSGVSPSASTRTAVPPEVAPSDQPAIGFPPPACIAAVSSAECITNDATAMAVSRPLSSASSRPVTPSRSALARPTSAGAAAAPLSRSVTICEGNVTTTTDGAIVYANNSARVNSSRPRPSLSSDALMASPEPEMADYGGGGVESAGSTPQSRSGRGGASAADMEGAAALPHHLGGALFAKKGGRHETVPLRIFGCAAHDWAPFVAYCLTCEAPICAMCTVLDHPSFVAEATPSAGPAPASKSGSGGSDGAPASDAVAADAGTAAVPPLPTAAAAATRKVTINETSSGAAATKQHQKQPSSPAASASASPPQKRHRTVPLGDFVNGLAANIAAVTDQNTAVGQQLDALEAGHGALLGSLHSYIDEEIDGLLQTLAAKRASLRGEVGAVRSSLLAVLATELGACEAALGRLEEGRRVLGMVSEGAGTSHSRMGEIIHGTLPYDDFLLEADPPLHAPPRVTEQLLLQLPIRSLQDVCDLVTWTEASMGAAPQIFPM